MADLNIDIEKVWKLFEKYDTNKNQTLEKREFTLGFKEMLNQLGENMPMKRHEQVAEEGIAQFDLNGNGSIEFNEFLNLLSFGILEKGYVLQ